MGTEPQPVLGRGSPGPRVPLGPRIPLGPHLIPQVSEAEAPPGGPHTPFPLLPPRFLTGYFLRLKD